MGPLVPEPRSARVKIRVLEILATLKRAGAENVAVSLVCGLDPDRFDGGVVSLYDAVPGGFEAALDERGIAVWHLGKRHGLDPRMWPRLRRVIREFQPDILHTHSYILRYALPATGLRERAMVHTVHNLAEKDVDVIGRAINRVAFRLGAIPVAVSTAVERSFRRTYGFGPAAVIPNGVNVGGFFRPDVRKEWRRAHGFEDDDILVASVARLDPQKDPLSLIRAFSQGPARCDRCHLLLAGEGTLREAALRCAQSRGVVGRVHFLGVRPDVPELLSASDLFALASRWEGGPLVVVEAMAAGLPVVATTVGGINEMVEPGKTGLLAPPGDIDTLADGMALLVNDSERRRAMGETARARAAKFDVSAMVASYGELFERVVKERR